MNEFGSILLGELGKLPPPLVLGGSDHADSADESRDVTVDSGYHVVHVG